MPNLQVVNPPNLIKKYKLNKYIKKWKLKFQLYWEIFDIKESDIEFDDNLIIIDYYF